MPFYDFKCSKCGDEFEVLAKMSQKDDKTIICPACGGNDLTVLYKNFNVVKSMKNEMPAACPNIGSCGGCPIQ